MKNVYSFESINDEVKTGWQWVDKHPVMKTPPVWDPLEREVVDTSISCGEWLLFAAGVLFGLLGASLFV